MPDPLSNTAALRPVLTQLADGARAALGGGLVGVYVQGSFALGAGDEHSDLDFLVVTETALDARQWDGLARLHATLPHAGLPYADRLEGSYAPSADLRDTAGGHGPWPYVDNGSTTLVPSDHDDNAHVRWILRERGIVVAGPATTAVTSVVDPDELRAEAIATAQTWLSALTADPGIVDNAYRQLAHVLALCRVLYTVVTGEVTSKQSAARWATAVVPSGFAEVIAAALSDRRRWPALLGAPADPDHARQTVALQHWVTRRAAVDH